MTKWRKKLKEVEGNDKISNMFTVFETLTKMWASIEVGKVLEKISVFQPKRV
jgi:hypothetical protein